jgi:hypothetical protein
VQSHTAGSPSPSSAKNTRSQKLGGPQKAYPQQWSGGERWTCKFPFGNILTKENRRRVAQSSSPALVSPAAANGSDYYFTLPEHRNISTSGTAPSTTQTSMTKTNGRSNSYCCLNCGKEGHNIRKCPQKQSHFTRECVAPADLVPGCYVLFRYPTNSRWCLPDNDVLSERDDISIQLGHHW